MKLSVCITTYNRSKELDLTLESLSNQTRLPDELIVSDDCSPDNTFEIIEKWKDKFPGFKYNRNKQNLYMPGNLNAAIHLAQGEYIANLHDADFFDPTMLEKWENALDTYPSAGFVFSGIGNWHTKETPDGVITHDVEPITKGKVFYEKYFLHRFPSIVWGTVMARKSAYDQLLPFDKQFGFISDVDMWMRMCQKFDVAYIKEPLILLDHSPTNERKFSWHHYLTLKKMQEVNIQRFYSSSPDQLKNVMRAHKKVSRRECLRRLAGRIYHADVKSVVQGINILKNSF